MGLLNSLVPTHPAVYDLLGEEVGSGGEEECQDYGKVSGTLIMLM